MATTTLACAVRATPACDHEIVIVIGGVEHANFDPDPGRVCLGCLEELEDLALGADEPPF